MSASINSQWSQQPASGSGRRDAAPVINRTPEQPAPPRFTIDGVPAGTREPAPPAPPVNNTAAEAFSVIEQARRQYRQHLDAVASQRQNLTPEGQQAAIEAFAKSTAAQAVDMAAEAVQRRAEEAAAEYARVRESLSPQGDTAAELRATRAWNRHRAVLEAQEDGTRIVATAKRAVESADRETLGTLLVEMPMFLESKGLPTDWLESVTQAAVPELANAQRAAREAERERQVIAYDANTLRNSFGTGRPPARLVDPSSLAR